GSNGASIAEMEVNVLKNWPVKEMGFAVAFIVLLATLYAGSYAALVTRDLEYGAGGWAVVPVYRLGGEYSERFFSMLDDVDLKIRPEYWTIRECVKELWRSSPCNGVGGFESRFIARPLP